MKESQLQDQIRLALGKLPHVTLWRNNIGVAEVHGYKIRFGVGGKGGADLIGIKNGRFVALEIKTPVGRQTEDQRLFEQLVRAKGGEYIVVRSVEEALTWANQP